MTFFLSLTFTLFVAGFLNCITVLNKNMLTFLVASEVMFLGLDLAFIGSSLLLNNFNGIIYAFIILMLTVGESVIGLGLSVTSLKLGKPISFLYYTNLKC